MDTPEEDDPLSRRLFLAGTAGTVAAAATSAGVNAEDDDEDENGDEEMAAGGTETVEVGDNWFEPEDLGIEPGTTVVWEWVGDVDHNINPTDIPDDSDWEGHPELISDGTYEYTFDVEGNYAYTCDPHPGMDGTIEVAEGAAAAADGPAQLVPDAAWTLLVATVAGMVSTLSLVYFFMRYGGEPAE